MQRTQKWIRATSSLLALWTGLHAVAEASGQETKEAPPLPASGGSGSATAPTADAQDYHRRALQAFTEARYEQALQLFSLGYADTKHPELLIRIGQTYLKLGRSAEALQACQAYLVRMETPEPTYKGYAEQCIAEAKRSADRGTTAPSGGTAAVARAAAAPATVSSARDAGSAAAVTSKAAATSPPVTTPPAAAAVLPAPVVATPAAAPAEAPVLGGVSPTPTVSVLASPRSLAVQYEECLAHQREGRVDAARACYLTFLPGALRDGGVTDGNVGATIAQLQRFPDPVAAFPMSTKRFEDRTNPGLWGAGLALWLAAMVPPAVMGPLYARQNTEDKNIYYTLMVPIVGPFISGIWLPLTRAPGDARNELVKNYTLPWVVGDGITQLAGFTMLLAGAQKTRVPLTPTLARYIDDVHVSPVATGGGSGIGLVGRF